MPPRPEKPPPGGEGPSRAVAHGARPSDPAREPRRPGRPALPVPESRPPGRLLGVQSSGCAAV
eukprot:8348287-Lingulodinium_polyedra.AAC.1